MCRRSRTGHVPRGSGHPDLSQRPRREAPGLLTGLAILERELGIIDYETHLVRRRLAGRPGIEERRELRARLRELDARHERTIRLLDDLHAQNEERVERGVEAIRARASRSPRTRRETREEARRRLGIG
jgi:hypothetical protein